MTKNFGKTREVALGRFSSGLNPMERRRIRTFMRNMLKLEGTLNEAVEEAKQYAHSDGTPFYTDEMISYMVLNWVSG